jgi:cytochrome c-type biogenesis protein CcmH
MRRLAAIGAMLALAACPAALASGQPRASQADLEGEIMCPVCSTTLDQSDSPIARNMKADIARRIAAGESKQEIKDALVAEFGPGVLASTGGGGLGVLAWLVPLVALVAGAIVLAVLVRGWSRRRSSSADATSIDPELDRRLDEELARFDA